MDEPPPKCTKLSWKPFMTKFREAACLVDSPKALGPDLIPARIWALPSTTRLIQTTLEDATTTKSFPKSWEQSYLYPIYKGPKAGERSNPSSYRTITIRTHLTKVLARTILMQNLKEIIDHGVGSAQFGGIPKRSTCQPIQKLARLISANQPVNPTDARSSKCFTKT